jgi:hypothetical protein
VRGMFCLCVVSPVCHRSHPSSQHNKADGHISHQTNNINHSSMVEVISIIKDPLYYQDRPCNRLYSELSFRFQPRAAAKELAPNGRQLSENNAFTAGNTGYTESAVLFDECAIILVTKTFIKFVIEVHIYHTYKQRYNIVVSLSIDCMITSG